MNEVGITAWAALVGGAERADEARVAELAGTRVVRAVLSARALWPDAPDRIGRMDRPSVHALLAARGALARLDEPLAPSDDVGVIVGTALGCAEVNDAYHRGLASRGAAGASPLHFAQTIPSAPAGEVAIAFGLRGHSATLMAGRCSGVAAVAEAVRAIRRGRCAGALVIAGDTFGEDRVALRNTRGEAPPGEATVALLLEPLDRTERRVHAVIRDASVRAMRGDVPAPETDWLGATGLIDLARWLDDGATDSLDVEVRCPTGRRGTLSATRR